MAPKESTMKRLSVTVDPKLIEEAMSLAGAKTGRDVIETVLGEFVRNRARAKLREMAGAGLLLWTGEELARWRESGQS